MIKNESQNNCITLSYYIDNWLKTHKAVNIKPASYDRLESVYKNHICGSSIGNINITAVTPTELKDFFEEKTIYLSNSSLLKIYDILNNCFRYAVAVGEIKANPLDKIHFERNAVNDISNKESKAYSKDDLKKLINEVDYSYKNSKKFKYSPAWLFIMNTGVSESEVLALKWEKVNFDTKKVIIDSTMSSVINRTGKGNRRENIIISKKSRSITLNNDALEALKEILRRYISDNIVTDYVICTETGKPQSLRCIQDAFKSFCKSAKVEYKGISALHISLKMLEVIDT